MPLEPAHAPAADIRVRKAARGDLDALTELERRVFATDRLSRRSLRRFLASPSAAVSCADSCGVIQYTPGLEGSLVPYFS